MKKTTFTESVVGSRDRQQQSTGQGMLYALFLVFSMVLGTQQVNAQCSMACSNANIGIAQNCIAFVSPLSVARNHGGCNPHSNWVITIRETMNGPAIATGTVAAPAQINGETYLNRTLVAEVLDQSSGNRCWAFILIEDKSAPRINCNDITLNCDEMLEYEPEVTDNCKIDRIIMINETRRNGSCDPVSQDRINGITSVVTRTYVAIDHVGLRDTCTVSISVRRPDISLITCPRDEVTVACNGNWDRDNNGNPHPSVTGYPTYNGISLDPASASLYCNLMVGYQDFNLSGFCLGERKIMRQWRVDEWYCGRDSGVVCVQVIILKDDIAPVITCPANTTVNTGFYTCASTLNIARPAVTDNCSPNSALVVDLMFRDIFINNFQGGNISGFQVGDNVITFRAYDNCGNSSSCTQTITVVDQVAPIAICRTFTTTSLGTSGTAQVPWSSFDDGSYDNCGIDRIEVRRMDGNICDPVPAYREYIPVCCLDVAAPVMVVLRVFDTSGNSNTCMVELEVQDKLPAVIQCPPNGTVECGFDLDDLSVFGRVANQILGQPRNPVIINGVTWGQDGFAFDNCDVTISLEEDVNLTGCGAGTVTRTFRAIGAGNNMVASCTQVITVVNNVNYLPQSIIWPCDIMLTNFCTNNPTNDLTPDILRNIAPNLVAITKCPNNRTVNQFFDRPRYSDDECTQVGVSWKDHVFEISDSACYKIIREWKLVDWCAMEQNPGRPITEFIYNHIQEIKIKNTVGPDLTCADGDIVVCSFQNDCSIGEIIELAPTAFDDCTATNELFWRWEYFRNNGNTVTASGNTRILERNFPVGTHRVRYLVEDKCGNTAACNYNVIVRDCKQPTPICHHLVIDLMITGEVRINASTFNAGSFDNCTPQADLVYRIERRPFATPAGATPPQTAGTSALFDCDDLGPNDVRIWVGDTDGNWDFCETTLLVQNNVGANCATSGGIIAGRLKTENQEGVENAHVNLEGLNSGMYVTGNEGMFEFQNLQMGQNFTLKPQRLDNPLNGVSTMDILMIQRHILGLESLNSPYKIIAADVNRSNTVTGADLVEIRRLILNSIENFGNAPSWRFVPRDYQFFDVQNPLAEAFPEQLQIINYQANVPVIDFVAIKVGDVNESVKANSTSLQSAGSRSSNLILELENTAVKVGNSYELNFTSADFSNIFGYQFTLGFDPGMLKLEDVKSGVLDVKDENFGFSFLKEGMITSSWNSLDAVSTGVNDVLFTLVFKAVRDGELKDAIQINSAVTQAEAYNDLSGQAIGVQLGFRGDAANTAAASFELFQNRPNPFDAATVISFNLPEAQSARLTVYDLNGKVVYTVDGNYNKGYNEVQLHTSVLNGVSGVLYYELKTETATAVKKMVRLN